MSRRGSSIPITITISLDMFVSIQNACRSAGVNRSTLIRNVISRAGCLSCGALGPSLCDLCEVSSSPDTIRD